MAYGEWKQEGDSWDDSPEVWELQSGPHLTVGDLRLVLEDADPSMPIRISLYEGAGSNVLHDPVHMGYIGTGDRPDALVMTVARLGWTSRDG